MSSNTVTLSGNIAFPPNIYHNQERGTRKTTIRLAHTLPTRQGQPLPPDKNDPTKTMEPAIFIDCVLFQDLARRGQFLQKGQAVCVVGNLSMEYWPSKTRPGQWDSKIVILAKELHLVQLLPSTSRVEQMEAAARGTTQDADNSYDEGDEARPPRRHRPRRPPPRGTPRRPPRRSRRPPAAATAGPPSRPSPGRPTKTFLSDERSTNHKEVIPQDT